MSNAHNTPALQALAKAIVKARHHAGIKQDVAAKILHITRSTLSRYENGHLDGFTICLLLDMSRLYNCTVIRFFEDAPVINPAQPVMPALPFMEGLPEHLQQLKTDLLFLIKKLS